MPLCRNVLWACIVSSLERFGYRFFGGHRGSDRILTCVITSWFLSFQNLARALITTSICFKILTFFYFFSDDSLSVDITINITTNLQFFLCLKTPLFSFKFLSSIIWVFSIFLEESSTGIWSMASIVFRLFKATKTKFKIVYYYINV